MKISERVGHVEYAIRDVILYARELEKKGRDIIYLNIGDPVLYDFKTPGHIKEALARAVRNDQNNYASSEGVKELREAIAEKEGEKGLPCGPEDVIVTNGVSEGVDMVMASILDPGDEILVPGPCYPPYSSYARLYGGVPVEYGSVEEEGWAPDLDDLRKKTTKKAVAITVISPNNPTGAVYSGKALKEIAQIAAEHKLYLICDEIYDRIVFEEFESMARHADDVPLVMLNGFSKVYLMTGWRLGYIARNGRSKLLDELWENMPKMARLRIASNTPAQVAAVEALRGPQDHVREMVSKLRERRDYVMKRLDGMDGISCVRPKGAFYVFPKIDMKDRWKSDAEFVIDLLKSTGVITVHGSGFGKKYGAGHFRIVYLPPVEVLEEAMNRLEKFIK